MSTMKVMVNGEEFSLMSGEKLQVLLAKQLDEKQGFAVAVNEVFVPRSAYASTTLQEGDRIELLVPMQGG